MYARLDTGAGISGDALGDTYTGVENLTGSGGGDILVGDAGTNTLTGGAGADYLTGQGGTDTVSYSGFSSAVTVNLATGSGSGGDALGDTYASIESIIGSAYADTLTGDASANTLNGGAGDDTLTGGAGDDLFVFGNFDDDDTVNDFAAGSGAGDILDIQAFNFADFDAVIAACTDSGSNCVVSLDADDEITLIGVQTLDLTAGDFLI